MTNFATSESFLPPVPSADFSHRDSYARRKKRSGLRARAFAGIRSVSFQLRFPFYGLCALALSGCGLRASLDSTPYRPLAIGEAYRVTSALTGLPAAFHYHRPTERRYRVTVPAVFRAADATVTPKALEKMAARTAMCLEAVQPALVGPNGEELEIRLVPVGLDGLRPLEVAVTARPVRGHARLWQLHWSCSQIVHEIGHFLGLVDTYPERSPIGLYDCRREGPSHSIMFNPRLAYAVVSPRLDVFRCSCEGRVGTALAACRESLSRIDATTSSCPRETDGKFLGRILEYEHPELAAQAMAQAEQAESADGLTRSIVVRYAPQRRNLLTPAEFRIIAHPNWLEGNAKYYACAVDAYRTSRAVGGEGCVAPVADCQDGTWASH